MILTVDIGNSRIKKALWLDEKIVARGVVNYSADNSADAFDELFAAMEKPSHVFAVCVAGDKLSHALSEWSEQYWQLSVDFLKTERQYENIVNAYADPGQHGVDRWAAVVAGHQSFPDSSVCVISAGTAITFDLIDKNAQHLGGYILPSYVTMHKALLADTANVEAEHRPRFREHGIPDNTNDAVDQGLHKFLQAGMRELCQVAKNEMDESMEIILTGGFAETILDYPDMPKMHHDPDLVMQGLYTIMMQQKY